MTLSLISSLLHSSYVVVKDQSWLCTDEWQLYAYFSLAKFYILTKHVEVSTKLYIHVYLLELIDPMGFEWFKEVIFKLMLVIDEVSLVKLFLGPTSDVNIVSGNGLLPSGNKPLPELMLTKISDIICLHQATVSYRHYLIWLTCALRRSIEM